MDFFVCSKAGCEIRQTMMRRIETLDVEDEREAISEAHKIALAKKEEGFMVALFTQDAEPICGWKVMEGGKLKDEPKKDVIQDWFNVTPEDFKLAKREKNKRDKKMS